MTPTELQQLLLDRAALRVGPEMAACVLRRWQSGASTSSVIATDARTGVPIRQELPLGALDSTAHSQGFNDSIIQ